MRLPLSHLTALLWFLLSTNADNCVYKECDCYDEYINCDYKDLTQMPLTVNLSDVHRTLLLSNNMITDIPANSLPYNLTEMYLRNNPTTIIADTAFEGSVHTLQIISLSLALFTRIPNAFGHLRALQSLFIQDVNVQDWNDDAMGIGGQTLTLLELDNVSLSSWPNWIQNCSQLTDLTITHGSLQSIPDGAFDKVSTTLTLIDLSNNSLTSIPKALSQLLALSSLNLENNNIVTVTWLPQHSQLSTLYLTNNKMSNASLLSQALSQIGSNITSIEINFNQLTTIPDFTSMTNIGNIDFSHNKISDPYSGSFLPTINTVDMSYNFLPAIPSFVSTHPLATVLIFASNVITSFVGTDITSSAKYFDLGFNLITELNDNSFPNNSQLTTLSLNNNPIVTISNLAFTHLPHLIELNLRNIRITRLPLGLRSLTKVSWIDMTEINSLVCTCLDKCLESWVVHLYPNQVLGNCGVLSVHDFFSDLSPNCPTQCCNETECSS